LNAYFGKLSFFSSFISFVVTVFTAMSIDVSDLRNFVSSATSLSERLNDSPAALAINVQFAFEASFVSLASALSTHIKIIAPRPTPILVASVERINQAHIAISQAQSMDLSFFGLSHASHAALSSATESSSETKRKVTFGTVDATSPKRVEKSSDSSAAETEFDFKPVPRQICKDVGEVLHWHHYYSLTSLKKEWKKVFPQVPWHDDVIFPIMCNSKREGVFLVRCRNTLSTAQKNSSHIWWRQDEKAKHQIPVPPDFR
jgi:hypothetical protein